MLDFEVSYLYNIILEKYFNEFRCEKLLPAPDW